MVIAKEDDRALLISHCILDVQPYAPTRYDTAWETSSLRKWLNETFINSAFSSDEQSIIQPTTLTAENNPSFSTSPGNDTVDKVFLLSFSEFNNYLSPLENEKKGEGTSYYWSEVYDYEPSWWLRSPGDNSNWPYAAAPEPGVMRVIDGDVFEFGTVVDNRNGVRPAMWINFNVD